MTQYLRSIKGVAMPPRSTRSAEARSRTRVGAGARGFSGMRAGCRKTERATLEWSSGWNGTFEAHGRSLLNSPEEFLRTRQILREMQLFQQLRATVLFPQDRKEKSD